MTLALDVVDFTYVFNLTAKLPIFQDLLVDFMIYKYYIFMLNDSGSVICFYVPKLIADSSDVSNLNVNITCVNVIFCS